MRVRFDGFDGDTRTSADVLAQLRADIAGARMSVAQQQVVDPNHAYALLNVTTDSGHKRLLLRVYSKDQERGFFYLLSVYTDTMKEWAGYYPLIRAMVEGWVDHKGRSLKVPLPATLP